MRCACLLRQRCLPFGGVVGSRRSASEAAGESSSGALVHPGFGFSARAPGFGLHRRPPPPNNSFKPTPCRGIGHVLYATLAHVRRPATGRLNSGVRRQKDRPGCISHTNQSLSSEDYPAMNVSSLYSRLENPLARPDTSGFPYR
jgi:hypothetical protein